MPKDVDLHSKIFGFTPGTLNTKFELANPKRALASYSWCDLMVEVRPGFDTVWIIIRREGKGAIALRPVPGSGPVRITKAGRGKRLQWRIESASGTYLVSLALNDDGVLRITTSLTPKADLLVAFWPRDLYPLGPGDDPTDCEGWVDAGQRGINTGLCYFCLDRPSFGRVLYVQNLTALNPYFAASKTRPDGVVGGQWPELGYQPPTAPMGDAPPIHPLPKGEPLIISDALLTFRNTCDPDEGKGARDFIEMLAAIYPYLDKPTPKHHDWLDRAARTVRDLAHASDATIEHYGHTYLHPYTGAEYPDSMVQASVLSALREYDRARGESTPFADQLEAGMGRFFDKELGAIRRYLPNVGDDKDKDAVDSWYLYHPLMNLGGLALHGDKKADRLFRDSLDYAIKAAHHFDYVWPIQFNVQDFKVITASRNAQGLGQTDVGGIYAYVMLQAYELTDDVKYLHEAKKALRNLRGARFEIAYQTNLTAWGAAACIKLWRLEQDPDFLAQSDVFIASFLHNCELWDSQIDNAKHYTNFFGVTCLHDAGYMAAYECFESFSAFDECLRIGGAELSPATRLLLSEYRRYALDFTWSFYPDALPPEAVAKDKIRNGHIDRALSFPLEDLYGDGQAAGQVGQEIYGCGGAFLFASRAFFECGAAAVRVFVDYPAIVEQPQPDSLIVRVQGPPGQTARVRVLRKGRRAMPRIAAALDGRDGALKCARRDADFREYELPADGAVTFTIGAPSKSPARSKARGNAASAQSRN